MSIKACNSLSSLVKTLLMFLSTILSGIHFTPKERSSQQLCSVICYEAEEDY
jgi:hypothetical protein